MDVENRGCENGSEGESIKKDSKRGENKVNYKINTHEDEDEEDGHKIVKTRKTLQKEELQVE